MHFFAEVTTAMRQAHMKYNERKEKEAEEKRRLQRIASDKAAEEAKQKAIIEEAKKRNDSIKKKEVQLQADEEKLDQEYQVSVRMLESANTQLEEALAAKDMVAVGVAKSLMDAARTKLKEASVHRTEQAKARSAIGCKRQSAFDKLMKAATSEKKKKK